MKTLTLTRGLVALIDDGDFDRVRQIEWYASKPNGKRTTIYARSKTKVNGQYTSLHRFVMEAPGNLCVDHINGDGLDCRRSNMRLATTSQNLHNRGPLASNTSGYKGVTKQDSRWAVFIRHNGEPIYLGRFKGKVEAAKAYDAKARELYGEFAYQNFPKQAGPAAGF